MLKPWGPEDRWPHPTSLIQIKKHTALQTVWTFLRFTFLTTILILSVNKEVARTLGEPGQDDELHDCRDTRGGQQDGPVLFSAQKLSVESHATQRFNQSDERPPPVRCCCQTIGSTYLRPTTCPIRIPAVRKMEVPIPMAPRSAVGAISPKYRGWTQRPMPVT